MPTDPLGTTSTARDAAPEGHELHCEIERLTAEIAGLRQETRRLTAALEASHREIAAGPVSAPTRDAVTKAMVVFVRRRAELPMRLGRWRAGLARRLAVAQRAEWRPGPSLFWDAAAVTIVAIAAILFRFVGLSDIPQGVHGDEAMAVLEGRRALNEGWFGVWDPMAGGFPAGFIYLAAPMVWLFGNEILAIRYLSCSLDLITVLALYFTLRRSFGYWTALIGSALLATSAWHIQFSRIAFPNILWPTLVVLGCVALGEAWRRGSLYWWAGGGALFALAIYSYNSHFLYVVVVGLFISWHFLRWRGLIATGAIVAVWLAPGLVTVTLAVLAVLILLLSPRLRSTSVLRPAGSFAAGFALAVYPMASFIVRNQDVYFGRGRALSIFRSDAWKELDGVREQALYLGERYWDFWSRLVSDPRNDAVDGSGAAAIIPSSLIVLSLVGIGLGLARRRHPLIELAVFTVALMPFAALTTNDLALRRAMIIAPFLALLGALGTVESVRIIWSRRWVWRVTGTLLVAALLAHGTYRGVDGFFRHTVPSDSMHWVMSIEWEQTTRYMESLPNDSYIYLYSERWPFSHEVRVLLAPDAKGESRGEKFGENSLALDPAKGKPVIILMGKYQALLPEFQATYPGGIVISGPPHWQNPSQPIYISYVLDIAA